MCCPGRRLTDWTRIVCLASAWPVQSGLPSQSTHGVNMKPVHELMDAMLRAMNTLHADMALSRMQSDAIFSRSMAAVQSVLRGPA